MTRRAPLTVGEKETIYFGKLAGGRLEDLATQVRCSLSCARKWWRIGRDGGVAALRQERPVERKTGALSRFDPLVAERVLYWKQTHPRRGPDRILATMAGDELLAGLKLPKRSTLAAFFKEACPELLQKRRPRPKSPPKAQRVHELWQMDAKENIVLGDGTILGCFAHAVQTEKHWRKLTLREIQADLRVVFTEFGLPLGLQTDRERVYGRPGTEAFPTLFTLWLEGLGTNHQLIRPGQPTDQPHVERGHRTWNDWLMQPEPTSDLITYRTELAQARYMHNEVLSSQAGDCQGRTPYQAHPEVRIPVRPFIPEVELLLFDLSRVDSFLEQFTWEHKITKSGQVSIGESVYYVGNKHAGKQVTLRFDQKDRHFVFTHPQSGKVLKRCPAKNLDMQTITGLKPEDVPQLSQPFQLPLPW